MDLALMVFIIITSLAQSLITLVNMKDLFYRGGIEFMLILTFLFVITIAWIIYHFIAAYSSKHTSKQASLRKLSYGKSMGLFALITGISGQLIGFSVMFDLIEKVNASGGIVSAEAIFGGIKATMIVTIYGSFIYLLSLLLWYVTTVVISKKHSSL